MKFCEKHSTGIQERMKDKIEVHLKNLGSDEHHIPLLPVDIAFIMGHEKIVKMLEGVHREKQETGRLSFFAVPPSKDNNIQPPNSLAHN